MFRIPCSPDDFFGVFLKRLDPAGNIGVVLAWIMTNTQFSPQHVAGQLCPQLFPGIAFTAKGVVQIPVKSALVPCPVAKFMQGGDVIPVRRGKLCLHRQVDLIA